VATRARRRAATRTTAATPTAATSPTWAFHPLQGRANATNGQIARDSATAHEQQQAVAWSLAVVLLVRPMTIPAAAAADTTSPVCPWTRPSVMASAINPKLPDKAQPSVVGCLVRRDLTMPSVLAVKATMTGRRTSATATT
jgi:hypothetical protein